MHLRLRAAIVLALLAAAIASNSTAQAEQAPARIIGGSKPSASLYQSQLASTVALVSMDASSQYEGQFCGGMLVDELHVLTAAHCVVENEPYSFRSAPSSIRVLAGTSALDEDALDVGSMVPVASIFVHPFFNLDTFRYDAAVLRLSRPVSGVPLLPLLTDEESTALGIGSSEVPARAAGRGDTDTSSDSCCFPSDLMTIALSIHTDDSCTSNLEDSPTWRFDPAHQICSGAVNRDTCQGDSGGPLLVEVGGAPRLAGVVSHGVGCGEGFFGIYAKATALREWFASIPGTTDGDVRDTSHGPDDSIAPTVTSATAAGFRHVQLTVASNGGPEFTGYTAWVRQGRAAAAEDVYLGRFDGPTFTVLAPPRNSAAKSRFLVRGLTTHGESPAGSVMSGPRIDRIAPSVARSVTASRRNGRLTVTWRAGSDRQSGVDGYQVQRRSNGGRWTAPRFVDGTRVVLRTGSAGQVRVRTVDRAGNASAWSRAVSY